MYLHPLNRKYAVTNVNSNTFSNVNVKMNLRHLGDNTFVIE